MKKNAKNILNEVKDEVVYIEFDTDPEEDLDMTPEYLKNRKEYKDDLEDEIKLNRRLKEVKLKKG